MLQFCKWYIVAVSYLVGIQVREKILQLEAPKYAPIYAIRLEINRGCFKVVLFKKHIDSLRLIWQPWIYLIFISMLCFIDD